MDLNEKQLQILETAERLFGIKGYDGTSVRDISEEAGVNVAMISYYFGSKEKLLQALFQLRTEALKMTVENLVKDETLAPFEKVERLIDNYINRIMEKQVFHRIMICEQVINKNPVVLQQVFELKKKNLEVIMQLIKQGQKIGDFKKNIDLPLLMNVLTGTASQLMIGQEYYKEVNNLQKLDDEQFQIEIKKRLSQMIKTIFKALLTNEK